MAEEDTGSSNPLLPLVIGHQPYAIGPLGRGGLLLGDLGQFAESRRILNGHI